MSTLITLLGSAPNLVPGAATPWYLAGGLSSGNCVVAYRAKGAASYAASKINLNNPGVNDAFEGAAPAWSAADGWTCSGGQYLFSVVPSGGWSMLVQFSNLAANINPVVGMYESGNVRLNIYPYYTDSNVYYRSGGSGQIADPYGAGNAAVTPAFGYKNGAPHVAIGGTWNGTATCRLVIGGANASGSINCCSCKIQAFALYNITLSDSQVAALAAAMAAL